MTGAVHADWIVLAWPALDRAGCDALVSSLRIQDRLQRLVATRLGLPGGPAVDGPLAALADRPAAQMHEAAAMAAAAWYAASVRQVLVADEVEVLVRAIGVRARSFALGNPALAVAPVERPGAAALAARIMDCAGLCLAAWLSDLPPGPRSAALVKLPRATMDRPVTPADTQAGLRLMLAAVPGVLDAG